MTNTEVFILTHNKEIRYESHDESFKPIICGNVIVEGMNYYIKDNEGKGISTLYPFYEEMTGQYWAWKNSIKENIGFCHYNQLFLKNHIQKLKTPHIEKILNEYDMILPEKTQIKKSFFKLTLEKGNTNTIHRVHYPVAKEWTKIRDVIEEIYPAYLYAYDLVFEDKSYYENNMFITKRRILDDYMLFAFRIIERMRLNIDPRDYISNTYSVGKHFGEVLLNTYVRKNQLKVKELPISEESDRNPLSTTFNRKYPGLSNIIGSEEK